MIEKMINWGGNGPTLHLAHANSFHPGTYKELIENLKKDFEVHTFISAPLQSGRQPEEMSSWNLLRDEFIAELDAKGLKNIIGAGHSLGSTVSMMAAIKRPDLFSKLIIIEPPCIDQVFFTLLDILPYSISKHLVPPSRIALKRRHKWPSREEAFELLRSKKIFHKWSNESLKAYLEYGLAEDQNGDYRLTFSKHWESKIYCTIENPYKLFPKLQHPSLCIRASESDVIKERNWERWKKVQKNANFENIQDAGHLLPMEHPHILAKAIRKFAKGDAI